MLFIYLTLYLICKTNCNINVDVNPEFSVLSKLTSAFMTEISMSTKPEAAKANRFQTIHLLRPKFVSTVIQKTVTSMVNFSPTTTKSNKQVDKPRAVTKEILQIMRTVSPQKASTSLSNKVTPTIPVSTRRTDMIGPRKTGRFKTILLHVWPTIISNVSETYLTAARIKKKAMNKTIASPSTKGRKLFPVKLKKLRNVTPLTEARRKKDDSFEITAAFSTKQSNHTYTNSSHLQEFTPRKKIKLNELLLFWKTIYIACFVVSVLLLTCMLSVTLFLINSKCVKVVTFKDMNISNKHPSNQKPKPKRIHRVGFA